MVTGIVNANPKNATAANYSRLASALDRLDNPVGALAATEQGLALEPRNFDLLSQRWQFLAAGKRWADAAALYPRLLAAAPNPYFAEQVQARQVAALQAANQLAATRAALAARLGGATPPPLDENDLALLVRIDLQAANADTDNDALTQARQALAEGRARFPRAAAFARLEGELAKRSHDVEGQVAALRRLSDLQPAQKTDALAEIARVYRDAGRPDDAVAAAHALVLASPASAEAHTLLADLLLQGGHPDEGVARLQDAVRLSDKPNEVRLRLARVQADLGRDADARRTLDEAFEAAEDSHERLAITKPLAEAYQRENRLDELITRFQTLQQGEAEGWRYALYLAEIYQETKDYGAARRELAKALAARPHDGALLRQLVRIAEEEQNTAEVARYRALLAEVEPSDQNKFALVTSLLENSQAEAGFNALRAHLSSILKIPGAWDELLPLLARNDLTAKAGDLLTAQMGGEHADLKARFTLALFQAVAGNVEQARAAFWSVFDTKTGPAPLTAPAPPAAAAANGGGTMRLAAAIYGGDSIPQQRQRAGEQTRRTAQGLLSPGGFAGYGRGRGVFSLPGAAAGLPNTPSLTDTTRDAALLYLAALAVKDHTAAEFIAELDRHLAARDSSRADRLVAHALLEDVDGQTREIAAQVQNPEPGLDGFALARAANIAFNNAPQNRRYSESAPLSPAQCAALAPTFDPLLARVVHADPTLDSAEADGLRYFFLTGVGEKEKADAVRRAFLAGVDASSSLDKLDTALGLLTQGDFSAADRAELKVVAPAFAEAAAKAAGSRGANDDYYYPYLLFQEGSAAAKLPPEEFADVLASLITIWIPLAPPPVVGSALSGSASSQGAGTENDTLPPTRFFDQNTFEVMQSVAQSLHQGDAARFKAVLARLDQQAKDLPPARRIYPQLVAIYLEGLAGAGGDPAAALARAQALLATAPDDQDLRLLTGVLLGRTDHHAEAVALLNTVDGTRTAATPCKLQAIIFKEAKAAKDNESAKRAVLRLAAMRVPPEMRETLVAELRELGLNEQADAFAKPTAANTSPAAAPGRQHPVFDYETSQLLQKFLAAKDENGALALARNVLAALPPPPPGPYGSRGNSDYVLRTVLAAIKQFKKTDAFIADAEKQLAKDPDSLSLNYQLALLHQDADETGTAETRGTRQKIPLWFKLTRTEGGEIAGFASPDGQAWKEVARARVPLGSAPLAVLTAVAPKTGAAATLVADHVTLTPAPAEAAAAAPGASTLPGPWAETSLPADDSAGHVAPSAWSDGAFTVRAGGGEAEKTAPGSHLVYRPLGEAVEWAARVASLDGGTSDQTRGGIVLRAGLEPDAPYAALFVLPGGGVVFQHRDHADQSTAYWRKLAALQPKEGNYQRLLAHRLAQRGLRDEAVAVYDHLLDQSPDEGFSAANDLGTIYHGSRMLALVPRLLAWKPGTGNSPYGARANYGFTFFQVARECAAQKRPDLVIALCRRAAELDATLNGGSPSLTELSRLLLATLIEQGRRDEARDVLIATFLPPADAGQTAANAGATQLGFRTPDSRFSSRFNGNRHWLAGVSWGLDSVDVSGLESLELARTVSLLPDLQAALQARRTADPDFFANNDLDWLLTVVRLEQHDPALLADLPALLNGTPGDKPNPGRNTNEQGAIAIRLAIARRLLQWPGHEPLALEAFRSAQKVVADARNANPAFTNNLVAMLNLQQARVELLLDDAPSALATLRALSNELSSPPNAGSNEPYEELRRCLNLLLRAGPEADPVYVDLFNKTTKTLEARKNFYFAYDLEKNIRLGDNPHFQAFAWLLDDGGSGDSPDATLVYELRAEHPFDRSGPGRYPGSRGRSFPGSEGERTLTFSYGPDPEHFAPIGQLKTDRTFGTWTGPIPPGAGVLKVTIDTPRARDAAALAAEGAAPKGSPSPAMTSQPLPASPAGDYWLRIVRAPNLLTNPGFDGLSNRDPNAATFSLPGWTELPAGLWKIGTGKNPRPGRPYVQSHTFALQSHLITGTRIPVEAGHAYFQSGWVHDGGDNSTVRIGRRYLDADGNVLKTSECPEFSTLIWRWHSQRLLPKDSANADDAIPAKTAFIEPYLRVQGNNEWTGLYLGKMD